KNNSGVTPAGQCGTWIKEPEGGYFTSPNYPEKYPPERECVYIIEVPSLSHFFSTPLLSQASPRQCIDLFFDEKYSIEPSWECKFDHIEVRDGPFVFSPILGRFCGPESLHMSAPVGGTCTSSLWLMGNWRPWVSLPIITSHKIQSSLELGNCQLCHVRILLVFTICEFELSGPEGFVESGQIAGESRALQTEAVDCRWFIKAPPRARMHNSNECKRNFVAIYDGSSSVEHLKNKFCSTVANDVMLVSSVGVVRLWADEGSRKSKFRILFTTFHEPPCEGETFFCHSNMCINQTLVCNGIQNCVFPWDENHCKEKRQASILDTFDGTNLAIIGVTCGLVLILLIISVIIQVKQPRKKYIIRRDDFDPALLHPGFEPPHYELCTLRRTPSGDLNDAAMAEDYEKFHKLRRSSSKCIRDHHCGSFPGSMHGSVHGSRSNLSMRDATIVADGGGLVPPPLPPGMGNQQSPHLSQHTTPAGHRSILMMKHSYSQDGAEGYRAEEDEDFMMDDGPTTSQQRMYHHHMHHGTSGQDHTVHRTLSNDF
ncbi:hypothetical protein F7725_011716, partial [Dissostichus mawsoni]